MLFYVVILLKNIIVGDKMKKNIIIFFSLFNVIFSMEYIPKNDSEKEVLNKLRTQKIQFGMSNNELYNNKIIGDQSVNDILKDLLSNYLQLNIKYTLGNFYEIYSQFENGENQGIAFIQRDYKGEEKIEFTKTIFNNHLYVSSNEVSLNILNSLEGQTIYYEKDTSYNKFIKSILKNNDLSTKLVAVKNLKDFENLIILTPNPELYHFRSTLKVSNLSGSAIGFRKEFAELIPILNNALNEKYRPLIKNKINKNREQLAIENFISSLTIEEKTFLESLKVLNVIYEDEVNSEISYFSKEKNEYRGIAPNILNRLGQYLNIKINDVTSNKNMGDIMIFSKTEEREKKYLFSNKFYEIETFVVNLKGSTDNHKLIGVLNESVEKSIAEKYDTKSNIKIYDSYKEMIQALDNKEVDNLLIAKNNLNQDKYNVIPFEKAPINFVFNKNNILLKNIINKSLIYLSDVEEEIKKAKLEKTNFLIKKEVEEKRIKKILIYSSMISFIVSLTVILKLILSNKHKKELLKDPLSGLSNRIVFNNFCELEGKYDSGYVFIIDIDNFKDLNDKYGHNFGDSIIKEFSNFLKLFFQSSSIFRISGDEFYGVLKNDFNDIIEKLKSYKLYCPVMNEYNISYSIGLYKKEKNEDLHKAFKYADYALFKAKEIKGFSYKVADNVFIEKKERELKILELLNGNLDEIYAIYQPKINISSNKIIGGESLARCKSKILGDIYPNEFIPIAEKYDLIYKIDYKIAEETIKFVKELINSNLIDSDYRMSFNLSVKTFSRDDLVSTIEDLLKKYEVSGQYIEVEITESILVKDIQDILSKLGILINLSIQVSLDDFTAGHSTARLLPILPINIIKFDKSLLDSLEENEDKAKIIYQNLTSMIKDLNLKIVSEGIETSKQLEFLKEINIDYGQGYLISKPLIKDDYLEFLY